MRDALDIWYEREMEFLRNSCADFAARFPKIAGRLMIGPAGVADPHVERLIRPSHSSTPAPDSNSKIPSPKSSTASSTPSTPTCSLPFPP
ncbi:MAG UNVERIFIED_CONTAM: type VI secretion system baseplate subunit TssF [Planctomycetaceae bacterium]